MIKPLQTGVMLANRGSPFYHYMPLDGQQSFHRYGIRTLIAWLSTRVFRGGPRLLIQLAACVAGIFLLTRGLPQRASDVAFGRGYGKLMKWSAKPGRPSGDDGSIAGGLRVVVFGASDIATPLGDDTQGKQTWTEIMCDELECSNYLSFVPKPPVRSLSSNSLYASAVEQVAAAPDSTDPPGLDYSFFPELFPVPWHVPDFSEQVNDFLSRPQPRRLPKETVWVFSFGQWDVWNLAALPMDISGPIIDAMVSDVFINIEKLYLASMNESSIAHSDFHQSNKTRLDFVAKVQRPPVPVGDGAKAVPQQDKIETFRIIIPMIFDSTLVPGWKTQRPEIPKVHTKAEQLRNAASLTERWNYGLQLATDKWAKTEDPRPEAEWGQEEAEEEKEEREEKMDQAEEQPRALPRRVARFTADPAKPTATPVPVKERKKKTKLTPGREAAKEDNLVYPLRDAIIYDLQEYLTEMIVERQLRDDGIADLNGLGGKPESRIFKEVKVPCVQPAEDVEEVGDVGRPEDKQAASRRAGSEAGSANKTEIATDESNNNTTDSHITCDEPGEHLFYTALTLSPRAIDEIGKETAELIMANMTLRGYWESLSEPPKFSMPTGFKREVRSSLAKQ